MLSSYISIIKATFSAFSNKKHQYFLGHNNFLQVFTSVNGLPPVKTITQRPPLITAQSSIRLCLSTALHNSTETGSHPANTEALTSPRLSDVPRNSDIKSITIAGYSDFSAPQPNVYTISGFDFGFMITGTLIY